MQNYLKEFIVFSSTYRRKYGANKNDSAWSNLVDLAQRLKSAPSEDVLTNMNAENGLLFCLSLYPKSKERDNILKLFFARFLTQKPSNEFASLLKYLDQEEIINNLLPNIYEIGNRSSVTVYLAAKLGIKLQIAVFQTFLTTHAWSQTDLINLGFLILPNEKQQIITQLNQLSKTTLSSSSTSIYTQFSQILQSETPAKEPILPNLDEISLTPPKKLPVLSTSTINSQVKTSKRSADNNGTILNQSTPTNKETSDVSNQTTSVNKEVSKSSTQANTPNKDVSKNSSQTSSVNKEVSKNSNKTNSSNIKKTKTDSQNSILNRFKSLTSDNSSNKKNYIIAGVALIICFISTFSLSDQNSSTDNIPKRRAATDFPDKWIDVKTNKVVNKGTLKADNECNLGDLYLSRRNYTEALAHFKSANATDKTHLQSIIKTGVCYIGLEEYKKAIDFLFKAAKLSPQTEFTNMYIARAYRGLKDHKNASIYYEKELKIHLNVDIALEYANYLRKIGEDNKSMEVLNRIQTAYPGKTVTLANYSEESLL